MPKTTIIILTDISVIFITFALLSIECYIFDFTKIKKIGKRKNNIRHRPWNHDNGI